jgi:hypothetical protein
MALQVSATESWVWNPEENIRILPSEFDSFHNPPLTDQVTYCHNWIVCNTIRSVLKKKICCFKFTDVRVVNFISFFCSEISVKSLLLSRCVRRFYILSHVRGYTWRNDGCFDFINPWTTTSLNYTQLQHYCYSTQFQFTVAQALGFSVPTSRLLATGLNTENISSDH